MRLAGKSVLVTGGGSGIGKAIALAFAGEGANVSVCGRRQEPLNQTVAEIERCGVRGLAVAADVSHESDVERMMSSTVDTFGRLDVLVNNAGVVSRTSVKDCTVSEFKNVLETNLLANFMCCKYALTSLIATRGSIINIASTAGLRGMRNRVAYSSSKAGIVALTKCIALDLAPEGVRVNCICPGYIETDLNQDYLASLKVSGDYDSLLKTYPLGLKGTPAHVARAAIFFVCDAQWSTGVIHPIDGGDSAVR